MALDSLFRIEDGDLFLYRTILDRPDIPGEVPSLNAEFGGVNWNRYPRQNLIEMIDEFPNKEVISGKETQETHEKSEYRQNLSKSNHIDAK